MPNADQIDRSAQATSALHLAADAGAVLRRAGIRWATVSDPGLDGRGLLELDLLIHPDDVDRAEALVADLGFRRMVGWGRATHRFLVAPALDGGHPGSGPEWVKLDIVTDLCFGRLHEVATGTGAGCLAAAVAADDTTAGTDLRLHPADELMALVLHGALDKGRYAEKHRRRLAELTGKVDGPGVLAARCGLVDGDGGDLRWIDVVQAIDDGRWGDLLAIGTSLRGRLVSGHRASTALRTARSFSARHSAKVLTAFAARGRVVAVVGTDGTGKSTLVESMRTASPVPTRVLYGGTYRSGARRSKLPLVTTSAVLGRLFSARLASGYHRARGRIVVFDRHPMECLPGSAEAKATTRARRRLLASMVPEPDLMLVLDAPTEVIRGRRPEHEASRVDADRQLHLQLAADTPEATVIDAARPADEVLDQAVGLVWTRLVGRKVPAAAGAR